MQVGKIFLTMKKLIYTVFVLATLVFTACSNKVDLYSDEGETTIVYAMLDAGLDTNFIKITHSFIGNANELAQDYEASNYTYDEIDVKFIGVFEGSNKVDTLQLDTISKWIPYDPNSVFYSGCYQTYYYVDRKLKEGEEYKINVLRKADGVLVSAKTSTINTFSYKFPYSYMDVTFTDVETSSAKVEWWVTTAPYKSTASYFEVTGYFHYGELQPGAIDTTHLYITWPLGSGEADKLYNTSENLHFYMVSYKPASLYTLLENDKYLKENSPAGVKRFFEKFEFEITAIGEDLYNYYLITNSTSAIQDVPNYSNVDHGVGLVSSRVSKIQKNSLSEKTRRNVVSKFPQYKFDLNSGK